MTNLKIKLENISSNFALLPDMQAESIRPKPEELIADMVRKILTNPCISNEEKELIQQLLTYFKPFDHVDSKKVLEIVNQLIAGANSDHPYLGLYHFLELIFDVSKSNEGDGVIKRPNPDYQDPNCVIPKHIC